MDQTLPLTSKTSEQSENNIFCVGSSCMQGWRPKMEDAHTHFLSLPEDPGAAFFGLYDGHGGSDVARFAADELHNYIVQHTEYDQNIEEALKGAFLAFDREVCTNVEWNENTGSTAIVILIKENRLYCANVGVSRAVACVQGDFEALSVEHKPNNDLERKRITEAGGWINCNCIFDCFALSRSIGDFAFKSNSSKEQEYQIVTAYPDVEIRDITPDWEFIVVACDGIWEVLSNQQVVDFVRMRIGKGMQPKEICEELIMRCLAVEPPSSLKKKGGDNMTVILVCFLHDKPYEELVARCA